jgi:beta-lactamase superfamily II metal-dependent hydrolase
MPEVLVTAIDVGHGNSTVIQSQAITVVIDGGPGTTLLDFLENRGIAHVDLVICSHADSDHIAGVLALLSDSNIQVDRLIVNPDSKDSKLWESFRVQAQDSVNRGTQVSTTLNASASPVLDEAGLRIDVLSPQLAAALGSAGGTLAGQSLTSNNLSAVLKVAVEGGESMVLAGDADAYSFDEMEHAGVDLTAAVLLFPHHGGRPGKADPKEFAQRVAGLVKPKLVVFSNSRSRYDLPLPQIVEGVRVSNAQIYIACSQLATRCAEELPAKAPHLSELPAAGARTRQCCAGTMQLRLDDPKLLISPVKAEHQEFISASAPTAMCRTEVQLELPMA